MLSQDAIMKAAYLGLESTFTSQDLKSAFRKKAQATRLDCWRCLQKQGSRKE
jgi:hypothetical protein